MHTIFIQNIQIFLYNKNIIFELNLMNSRHAERERVNPPMRSLWEMKRGGEAQRSVCAEQSRDGRNRWPQEGGAIQVLRPLPKLHPRKRLI